jgi:cholesterol 7-dehydrogenase
MMMMMNALLIFLLFRKIHISTDIGVSNNKSTMNTTTTTTLLLNPFEFVSTLYSLNHFQLSIVTIVVLFSLYLVSPIVLSLYDTLFEPLKRVVDLETNTDRNARKYRMIGNVPPVFPNGWFKLCDSRELSRGKVIFKSIMGLQLAVYRSESGKAACLDAYCTHLGANLAIGGTVNGDCLTCPFHHWSFNTEGKCVSIGEEPLDMPILDKKGNLKKGLSVGEPVSACDTSIPKQSHTKSYRIEEKNDMIYLWHDAEGREPDWFVPDVQSTNNLKTHGKITHHIYCHVQEIPENGPDVYHLNIVHRDMDKNSIIRNVWGGSWKKGENNDDKYQSYFRVQHVFTFLDLFNIPFSNVDVKGSQIGPGVVTFQFSIVLGRFKMIQTVTPLGPLHQQVEHVAYTPWFFPRCLAKLMMILMTSLLEQDVPIWNNKTYRMNPTLVKSDGPIMQFRRWYSQFYSENSPTLKSLSDRSLDW